MSTHSLNGKIIQQRLIETIRKIHEVPELAQVCSLVATEAKELLGVDRVFIYELGRKF